MNDITSYITKSYSISGNNFSPRKCYNIYIKNHLFTNFNAPEKFSYPLHLAFCFAFFYSKICISLYLADFQQLIL